MQIADEDFAGLAREHRALIRTYGRAQARCSETLQRQAREIDALVAEVIRLRAAVIALGGRRRVLGHERIAQHAEPADLDLDDIAGADRR